MTILTHTTERAGKSVSPWGLERADAKISQVHEYSRHGFQLLVAWFTFFATANCATMGWLARPQADAKPIHGVMVAVSAMFIVENILGIITCRIAKRALVEASKTVALYEDFVVRHCTEADETWPADRCMPISSYSRAASLMALAQVPIVLVWIVFALPL
jgi:hypothetical protein